MEKYWILLISISLIATSHLSAGQGEEGEEKPPLPPLITAELPDLKYFIVDDDEISLDCEAEGTEPIEYLWEKIEFDNGGRRRTVKNFKTEGTDDRKQVKSALMIATAQAPDEGLYQCTVSNEHGTTLSKIVQLARTFMRKPKKSTTPTQNEAKEGGHFHIACDESRSVPQVSFSWVLKEEGGGKATTPVQINDRVVVAGDGSLMFAHVLPEDEQPGKLYQCEQRNPATDIKIGGKLNSLSVEGPAAGPSAPKLVYSTDLEGDTVVLSKHTRVQCIFSGNPTPTVRWTFRPKDGADDEPVPEVLYHPGKADQPDRTTLVRALGKRLGEDEQAPPPEGTLKCIGSNSEGDEEKEFPIKIEYPPRMAAAPSGRRVEEGDDVIFVCGADGNPKPTIRFLINGEEMDNNNPRPRMSVESMSMNWKPYIEETSEQLVLTLSGACKDSDEESCDGGEDLFSIQCNASNIHGSALGSGYLSIYEKVEGADGEEAAAEGSSDPNACTDPDVLESVDECKETYQDSVQEQGLCLAYCHYNVCVTAMNLNCNPPSIGDRSFCDGLCISKGLMKEPEKPGDKDKERHKGLSKKVITIICIIVLVLIVLLILFVLYKIYKKRQQKKKYRGVSTVYKPTTEA